MKRKHACSVLVGMTMGTALLLCGIIAARSVRNAQALLRPARKPVVFPASKAELSGMMDVSFQTSDNLTIRGWYLPSRNRAAIILTHGFGENRMEMLFQACFLARRGYGVLLFDWRTHGESDGDMSTWGDKEKADFRAALDFVAQRAELDSNRIGVIGYSIGGAVATQVLATDQRVSALILQGTVTSLKDAIFDDFDRWGLLSQLPALWTFRNAGIDVDSVSALNAIPSIHPRPLLLINGGGLDVLPHLSEQLFAAAGEPKEYWVIPGANHGEYVQFAPEEYERRVTAFFDSALLKKSPDTAH